MKVTYCFKLYHSKRNKYLYRRINICSGIYNHCIALHKRYYHLFHKHLSKYALQKHLTKLKKMARYQYWNIVGSQAVQDITDRIERGYTLFFHNLKRKVRTAPPTFRKSIKYRSFTLKQAGYRCLDDNRILIGKRIYKYFKSREIEGVIKTLTVKRDRCGDLYLYFVCEVQRNAVMARTGKSVGFDFSLKSFLVAEHEINDVVSPLFFKRNARAIKRAHKALSRKQKGSHNRKRAQLTLARIYRRAANQRNDFQWKLAWQLCAEYALICLESLNMKWMQRLHGRKVRDYGFADFVNKLEYVASQTGTTIVKVDKLFASSQLCHCCGYKNVGTKDLRVREWTCPQCGAHHDRDRNAAVNIRREGERIFSAA